MMSDKHNVVIEFGHKFTRAGFVNELAPRAIIKTAYYCPQLKKEINLLLDDSLLTQNGSNNTTASEELIKGFKVLIKSLYFRYLGVNFKERKVILVESILIKSIVRRVLITLFFEHFEVPSLLIVPIHLMALIPSVISTGIVLDVGYKEANAIPVVEGITLLNSVKFVPLGGKAINDRLKEELMSKKAKIIENGKERELTECDDLDESLIENIKVKTCFVAPFERSQSLVSHKAGKGPPPSNPPKDLDYYLQSNKTLIIPGSVRECAAEILFELYGEEQTVATILLESLLDCPKDTRRPLAGNIVIIGGGSMLPGFKHRLKMELRYLCQNIERYSKNMSIDKFLFHTPICKENYVAWLGASIFGTIDTINLRAITREKYLKSKKQSFPDWSEWWP